MTTLNPKFKLKSPKSEKETLILLKVYIDYKRLTYSINRTIHPNHWDSKNGRAIIAKGNSDIKEGLRETNTHINDIESAVIHLSNNYMHNNISVTPEILRRDLDEKLEKSTKNKIRPESLNEYIERFINEIENGNRLTDKAQIYQPGTIKNYKGFQTQFNGYQEKRRKKLDFDGITIDFYDDFLNYFNNKSYKPNTIGRHIKNLKTIMRTSREEGLHNNRETERNKFKVLKVNTDQIYLNLDELERLYNLNLSNTPQLELARDIFLIGCFTLLRFSDYSRIRKDNLGTTAQGKKVLRIITKKTGEPVIIPIEWHWILVELLHKYDYTVPSIYEQKLNKRIKEIGKLTELNDLIEIEDIIGGMKVKKSVPKYTLIMTHTARRSGATNMYNEGYDPIDIMKLTGHKTESSFLQYICITKEETANRIINMHKISKPHMKSV